MKRSDNVENYLLNVETRLNKNKTTRRLEFQSNIRRQETVVRTARRKKELNEQNNGKKILYPTSR